MSYKQARYEKEGLEGKVNQLKETGEELYQAMEMQLKRESGAFHIRAEVMLGIWINAMKKWNKVFERVQKENTMLRGAMAADDERLRVAGERAGVEHCGCDTAHWMADEILGLRNLIIEADAQFNEGKKPGDIESAGLALVRMCSEGRSAMDKVQELQQELDGMTSERDTQRELLGRSAEAIYGEYHDMRQGLAAITKDRNELYELKERSGICTWTASDDDEYWHTDCGEDFTLETGSPKDNGMRYCNFCGKQLVERINENETNPCKD